jgi:acetyl-CoA acetyltransferase
MPQPVIAAGYYDVVVAGGSESMSHARAAAAAEGRLTEEIAPVTIAGRKGEVTVEADEGIRPGTTAEKLAALPAAFAADGTITAGSASQLSDGACAVVVMSRERAEQRRRGGGTGAAARCGGGGQGDALIIHSVAA